MEKEVTRPGERGTQVDLACEVGTHPLCYLLVRAQLPGPSPRHPTSPSPGPVGLALPRWRPISAPYTFYQEAHLPSRGPERLSHLIQMGVQVTGPRQQCKRLLNFSLLWCVDHTATLREIPSERNPETGWWLMHFGHWGKAVKCVGKTETHSGTHPQHGTIQPEGNPQLPASRWGGKCSNHVFSSAPL